MTDNIILTREGFDKLSDELTFLKTKKRREVAKALEVARAHGDLRENAEYDAAKEAKHHLERRIADLEHRLASAKIIDPKGLPKDKAYLGCTLELKNLNTGDKVRYTLVAQDEADLNAGKISVTSPIGKGLLGKKPKETAEIQVPAGKIRFQIVKIERE